jgi:hypothetical protein
MKCVLHIGTEKTGTTLIQDWLYNNQEQLSQQGVYLSNILGKTNNRLFPAYFTQGLDDWAKLNKIGSLQEKDRYFKGFLGKLSREISRSSSSHELFLISSEHLHSRITTSEDIQRIKNFLADHFSSIRVVCYCRPQIDMVVSLYSTALKTAASVSLDEFIEKRSLFKENYYFNFRMLADNWSGVFGKENCSFRIYDRANFVDGDLRLDFLESLPISLELAHLNFNVESSNESLSGLMASIFRLINKYIPYWEHNNNGVSKLNVGLKKAIVENDFLRHGKIPLPSRKGIMEDFEESNQLFLRDYCQGGRLQPELEVEDRVSTFSFDDVEKIVESLCEELLPRIDVKSSPHLFDHDAVYLRDIAVKIEREEELSISDSLQLMQLAQRARPDGPVIRRKVKEYVNRLKLKDQEDVAP